MGKLNLGENMRESMLENGVRREVKDFAVMMEQKLQENNHKSGWRSLSFRDLLLRIRVS